MTSLTSTERDLIRADLGQLLEVLGLGDYARPESPHEVFGKCLAEVRRLAAELEHAKAAAAGSHEGVRLWMLDCGNLVQKHREHAVEASVRLGEMRERAEAAEAALAAVRARAEALTATFPEDPAGDWLRGRREAGQAVLAVISGGETPQADAVPLPSLAAICAYLEAAGWSEYWTGGSGPRWAKSFEMRVTLPADDSDPDLLRDAIGRIARAEGRTQGETAAAIHAAWKQGNESPETGSEGGPA